MPADRLLVETDAPYLAPEPYRGKPNEPAYVIARRRRARAAARRRTSDAIAGAHARQRGDGSSGQREPAPRLRALLDEHGVRPSKALGQHFLADPNTARRIVRLAGVEPGDRVVEVGPGVGSLTLALSDAGARVLAVELDRHLLPVLEEVVGGRDVEIVAGDALTVDWPALLAGGDRWAMVSNLPYNVATPVVVRALEEAPMIDRMLVMVQREVGERLAAAVGDEAVRRGVGEGRVLRATRRSSASCRRRCSCPGRTSTARSSSSCGTPPPVAVADPARLFELVRAGFATRRKTLRNALRAGARCDAPRPCCARPASIRCGGPRRSTLDDWARGRRRCRE